MFGKMSSFSREARLEWLKKRKLSASRPREERPISSKSSWTNLVASGSLGKVVLKLVLGSPIITELTKIFRATFGNTLTFLKKLKVEKKDNWGSHATATFTFC